MEKYFVGKADHSQRAEVENRRWKKCPDLSQLLVAKPSTFKPFSPPKLPLESRVSELINGENKWKEVLIQKNFMKEDAQQILNIPLPRTPKPDKLLWHFNKRGEYLVKSGY